METVNHAESIEALAERLRSLASDPDRAEDLARLAAIAASPFALSPLHERYFPFFEEEGFHLTPVHFYEPIPDLRTLRPEIWRKEYELVGIEMNDATQLDLVRNVFPRFRPEYEGFPLEDTGDPQKFYFNNGQFGGTDALALYCMLRHLKPNLVIEVGSGFSTRLAAQAAQQNGNTELICIEPYPTEAGRHDIFQTALPGLRELIPKQVEDVDLDVFQQLGENDVLFIDTSHVVRIGGDVNHLFLEVLPRLRPGVVVHVHDIFLPYEYSREWVVELLRFYTEQYLLQAFLCFNRQFEVLLSNQYFVHRYPSEIQATFPSSPPGQGDGSLWMRRVINPVNGERLEVSGEPEALR